MDREFNLKKVTSPIIVHLLKGQLPRPRLFLLTCLLTAGKVRKQCAAEFPAELVDLAALPLWVYINLKARLGQAKALEIMRIALLTAGVAKQNMLFDPVERGRSFDTFVDMELEINRSGTTKWNTLNVVRREPELFEIEITRCQYHELASRLGVPEVTPLICQVDNAVFNSYLPEEMIFHREGQGNRICDGAKKCRFIWQMQA